MASLSIVLNRLKIVILFLIVQTDFHLTCNALLLKCPLYQMHLQKIVGFRPPLDFMTERNLIYTPADSPQDRTRYTREGIYPALTADGMPNDNQTTRYADSLPLATAICWRLCTEDPDCIAYVHLLDTDQCYGYSYFERAQRYQAIDTEMPLVADAEAIFYEKTCLKVPEQCKGRLWTLTKIPGSSLVFQGKKTLSTLITRRECAENCLFETEFKCLSASFAPSQRNNRERFAQRDPPNQHITLGRCILSDKDKMIQPDAFRAAPYDEEYIENQCYERPIENDQCSYELYANSTFIYAEAKFMGLTQKECQSFCTHETSFYCQGVSYYFHNDLSRSECLLHSEDIISMGPRSLKLQEHSVYMRRVKCLDVQVLCTHDEMAVKYTPKDWFNGRMYVSQHSKNCMVQGNGTKSTLLRLPIGNELRESRCGILRAYEVTTQFQRIFISALVVIQNNANVQTQGDRLIKVGCIMSNSTNHKMADDNTDNDVYGEDGESDMPNAIALESSLEFTQRTLPNEGSLHFNTSGLGPSILPKITLQIIDLSHQHETNDVQIGQNLELQIVAEYTPQQQQLLGNEYPPLPDFRATTLIAKTDNDQNYVLLIDKRGCPIDVTVFPALERLRTRSKNILRARFHAFKFAGTSMVNFDVKIHFCTRGEQCPEDNCMQYGGARNKTNENANAQKSQNRRRRRQLNQLQTQQKFKVQNPIYISTVMDVLDANALSNRTNVGSLSTRNYTQRRTSAFDKSEAELPLNFNLHVRGPDMASSNSFIYGERGVLLIAGIDDQLHLDSICLNQSLLIAVLIFWLIFQVSLLFTCCYIMQKYKRLATLDEERRKIHEEFLDGRRVHWADQGGYTL